jgi:hypothetical protein
MNEDPLSDEAFSEWRKEWGSAIPEAVHAWQECARRAKANRWAAFSDFELAYIASALAIYGPPWKGEPPWHSVREQIKAELERRKDEASS